MSDRKPPKTWPGEPADLWPASEPAVRDERRTDAERIAVVRSGLRIEHAVSRRVGPRLVEFVKRPWEPHQRWRGMLLVGPASGRSWLLSRWLPRDNYPIEGSVINAMLPVDLSGDRIFSAIVGPSELKGPAMRADALQRLGRAGALVFDGCDHLAELSRPRLWRVLAKLKGIAEDRRVPLIPAVVPQGGGAPGTGLHPLLGDHDAERRGHDRNVR